MIRQIGQFWFITNAPDGAFHGYSWPTSRDAEEALQAVLKGDISTENGDEYAYDYNYTSQNQYLGGHNHRHGAVLPISIQREGEEHDDE